MIINFSYVGVCLINILPVNDAWRIGLDWIGLLFNGVKVAVLSSLVVVVVDEDDDEEDDVEEKNAFDNDGDMYSDRDCNIWLVRRTLADDRPPLGIDGVHNDDEDDEDAADDDNEIISLVKSTMGACMFERTDWNDK